MTWLTFKTCHLWKHLPWPHNHVQMNHSLRKYHAYLNTWFLLFEAHILLYWSKLFQSFPGGSGSKESAHNTGDWFDPWVKKMPWKREWQPTTVFLSGESQWTEEPGGIQSMGSQRVRHDWATKHNTTQTFRAHWWLRQYRICLQCKRPGFDPWVRKIPWRREWQATPVFLPGGSRGQSSLVHYSLWGCKQSDTTECLTLSLFKLVLEGELSRSKKRH